MNERLEPEDSGGEPKPLESKPAAFSHKNVTANANAFGLSVHGKGDQRPFFFLMDLNGGEASLDWINSFLEETVYYLMNKQLIYNMFYTKRYFWIELFLEFTPKKNAVL